MNIYPASQRVKSVTEHLQNGLQKGSAGIDSAAQKVGTGKKTCEFKISLWCSPLLQAQPLLDCLDQMPTEVDRKQSFFIQNQVLLT